MNIVRPFFSLVVVLFLSAAAALAATYYVDFAGGADANAGDSASVAFQHSPGDPAAKDKAAAVKLQPGDTVLFKGGVSYRGNIVVTQSGAVDKPITFDGNTAGKFGAGRAVIDGSEPLTGWKKCASADECDGNPNWQNIWWAEVPFTVPTPFAANLYENEQPLDVAQDPKPKCQVWPDPATEYFTFDVKNSTPTSIQDETHLTQTQAQAWDGAIVLVFAQDFTYKTKVTGFDPATHTLTFGSMGKLPFGKKGAAEAPREPGKDGRYALINALGALKYPGQYVVCSNAGPQYKAVLSKDAPAKIYLWPSKSGAAPGDVTITRRECGFDLHGQSNVTVEGFQIQKFVSPADPHGAAVMDAEKKSNGGVVVRNNLVMACNRDLYRCMKPAVIYLTNSGGSLVEKNQINDNRGAGGIRVAYSANHVIKENVIRRNGSIGINIWLDAKNCQVIRNVIADAMADSLGAHGPGGIMIYHGCSNILVLGNQVFNNAGGALAIYSVSNNGSGASQASDITIACNVFQYRGEYVIGGTTTKNVRVFHNVVINTNLAGKLWPAGCFDTALKQDNIFAANNSRLDKGSGCKLDEAHNLCADLAHAGAIFVDPDHYDYRLKKDSPAIAAVVPTEILKDARGTPWPEGQSPDVGAFVYTEK